MSDDPRVDAIWQALVPHIEWARGFSLILLFADNPEPVVQIRSRLEASLGTSGRTLRVHELQSNEDVGDFTQSVLAKSDPDCGALWIPMWWHGTDGSCDFLLQRLNERRFLLERDVARPVVLVLPADYRSKVYVLAPDLWTVRSVSMQLPEPRMIPRDSQPLAIELPDSPVGFASEPPGLAEREWGRLVSASNQAGLALEDGFLAYQSALERGSLQDARRIARETLMLVVRGVVEGDAIAVDVDELLKGAESLDSRARRELSRVLDDLGTVEEQAGNLARARELYERGLEVSERLAKADPHSAQAQRDLSVSCNKVGGVEEQAGNLARARELYERGLEVSERLAKADPHSAQAQRDLSISYENVGDVEVQAGNLAGARELFGRSLEVSEALAKADPHNARARFDVVLSLVRLADVSEDSERCDHLERAHAILEDLDANGQLRGYSQRELVGEHVRTELAELTKPSEPSASSDPDAR